MHRLRARVPHERPFLSSQAFDLRPRFPRRGLQLLVGHLAELAGRRPLHRNQLVVQVRRAPRRVLGVLVPVRIGPAIAPASVPATAHKVRDLARAETVAPSERGGCPRSGAIARGGF